MIETMEAVEMEKQRHHSTRMEALACLSRLEVYRCLPILSPTPSAIFMSNSADGVLSQVLAMLLPNDFAGHKRRSCKIACQGTMESGSSSMSSFPCIGF